MNSGFKVKFLIDDAKIIRDDIYDVNDVYQAIIDEFKANGIACMKNEDEHSLVFGTKKHEKFGGIMQSINRVCFSEVQPYLLEVTWYNLERGVSENVLDTFRREGLL